MRIRGAFTALTATVLLLCGAGSVARGLRCKDLNTCGNNMRMIASAKGSFGLENKLTRGEQVSPQQISELLKSGWDGQRCPAGGHYGPGLFTGGKDVGDAMHAPDCSIHGSLAVFESAANTHFTDAKPYFAVATACFVLAILIVLAYLLAGGRTRSQQ